MKVAPPPMEHHPNGNTNGVSSMEQGGDQYNKEVAVQVCGDERNLSLLQPANLEFSGGLYDKRLSCFGCGIGWFSFILGFVFPPLWYYATILYFANYYYKDPRERPGLAASAIAALVCSVAVMISLFVLFC
ncbi:hypothetical protein F0562_025727 [Nyssa sinensis]|uniref:Ribosomal protein L18ae family n=1 Tax=Nyssa sinensis TaxID=561372 RepID=A0A5J5B737_9ASTE|nr:hypothetical protein F0562_025727 [Nyssa sinensis]